MTMNRAVIQEMINIMQQVDKDEPIPVRAEDLARLSSFVLEISEFADRYTQFLPPEAQQELKRINEAYKTPEPVI